MVEAASPPLVYRALAEVVPEGERDPERLAALRQAVLDYKPAQAIARKQKANGLWGGNLLAPTGSKAYAWTEPGTVYQYRRLIELGWPPGERVFRDADRFLFQLLSRIEPDDPDKSVSQRALELLVEFHKPARTDLGLARWARRLGREAAACTLARGGHSDDPRLRSLGLNSAHAKTKKKQSTRDTERKAGLTIHRFSLGVSLFNMVSMMRISARWVLSASVAKSNSSA